MAVTAHVNDEYNLRRPTVILHDTEAATFEAKLASALVERWGMVAGEPDGEDAAGRSRLRLLTPTEVVSRACETTELLAAELRKRDWFAAVPPWDEIVAKAEEQRIKQDEKDAAARDARAQRKPV